MKKILILGSLAEIEGETVALTDTAAFIEVSIRKTGRNVKAYFCHLNRLVTYSLTKKLKC